MTSIVFRILKGETILAIGSYSTDVPTPKYQTELRKLEKIHGTCTVEHMLEFDNAMEAKLEASKLKRKHLPLLLRSSRVSTRHKPLKVHPLLEIAAIARSKGIPLPDFKDRANGWPHFTYNGTDLTMTITNNQPIPCK